MIAISDRDILIGHTSQNKKINMKYFSRLSIMRTIGALFLILLIANCKKEDVSTQPTSPESTSDIATEGLNANQQSQTRTPGLFNNNLDGNLVHNFVLGSASLFAFDDNLYAHTMKIPAKNGYALLVVQGFGFNIPANARIDNIYVKVRRFKEGKGSVKEYFSYLVKNRERPDLPVWWEAYGPRWADPNFFPAKEGEVNYSEAGSGSNGGIGNQTYQWTPARINDPQFGALFSIYSPVGGPIVIYYDLAEITVIFTLL